MKNTGEISWRGKVIAKGWKADLILSAVVLAIYGMGFLSGLRFGG